MQQKLIRHRSDTLVLDRGLIGVNLTFFAVQGLFSLSGWTSYRKISWSLKAKRFGFRLFESLWNLTDTSATAMPNCLSYLIAILSSQHPILRLWNFTRFGRKTSCRLVNRGLGSNRKHNCGLSHDDVMTWKRFPHCWPFVRGTQRRSHAMTVMWCHCNVPIWHPYPLHVPR